MREREVVAYIHIYIYVRDDVIERVVSPFFSLSFSLSLSFFLVPHSYVCYSVSVSVSIPI